MNNSDLPLTLQDIHKTHGGRVSDKWASYLSFYESEFTSIRDKPIRILEIGIQNGGSLEIWAKYFPKAICIVGCDINEKCKELTFTDPRIKLVVGDGSKSSVAEEIRQHSDVFDIVIDDGSHLSSDIVRNFALYFPMLHEEGLYICEDLHASYLSYFEGAIEAPFSSISFFKRLADYTNYQHWSREVAPEVLLQYFSDKYDAVFEPSSLSKIAEVCFRNSLVRVLKRPNDQTLLGNREVCGTVALVEPLSDISPSAPAADAPEGEFGIYSERAEYTLERRRALAETENALRSDVSSLSEQLAIARQQLTERDWKLIECDQQLTERDRQLTERDQQLEAVLISWSWRATAPLRLTSRWITNTLGRT